jgi:hypothetical protein
MPGLEPTIFRVSLWHSTSVPHMPCTNILKLNIFGAKYLSSFYSACLLILHSTRWLTMCVRILSNGSIIKQKWWQQHVLGCQPIRFCKVYHAYLGLKGTPVRIQHVEEIFFCLDIKKFWYSCEKDNYNDVNKHLFEKNVSTEKNPTFSRIELMISPIPSQLWSTAPLCHFCN